ncbi:hypothetical protein H4Q26_002815 [Puccinia striiformis f. sp. tritici PST-130]|nr:hypothetical protein H4Q26_002815 [Puccinia striiformis f. sp. tritici PST-130]
MAAAAVIGLVVAIFLNSTGRSPLGGRVMNPISWEYPHPTDCRPPDPTLQNGMVDVNAKINTFKPI